MSSVEVWYTNSAFTDPQYFSKKHLSKYAKLTPELFLWKKPPHFSLAEHFELSGKPEGVDLQSVNDEHLQALYLSVVSSS